MDIYYDDDFYEPSEAEAKLREIADMLKGAVKQEIKDELEWLRREKAELQRFKDKQRENDAELAQAFRELRAEREKLERTVKQARIRELLGEYIVAAWVVQRVYTEKPKCDKCNERREIVYYSPRGKEHCESCECAEKTVSYRVQATELVEIETIKKFGELEWSRVYYTAPTIWEDGKEHEESIERTRNVYDGKPFEEISDYWCTNVVFLDESKCQEFCDYLNNKEREKSKK